MRSKLKPTWKRRKTMCALFVGVASYTTPKPGICQEQGQNFDNSDMHPALRLGCDSADRPRRDYIQADPMVWHAVTQGANMLPTLIRQQWAQ